MALPCRTTGSLSPTFVPARLVGLAVKLSSAFALYGWVPISLREPLGASVTLQEPTAPVKLPARHGPGPGLRASVRTPAPSGWYLTVHSPEAETPGSKCPTYPAQTTPKFNAWV